MLIWLLVILGVVYLDQLTKWLVVTYLPDGGLPVIDGVIRFTYVENEGAAFGMLSEHRWIFILISTVALAGLLFYMFRFKPRGTVLRCSLSFIIGGGIGNMIDRILLGYVIDFIDFCAFPDLWMWVFNVADSFVCVGAGMLIVCLIVSMVREMKAEKESKNQNTAPQKTGSPETAEKEGGTEETGGADKEAAAETGTGTDETGGTGERTAETETAGKETAEKESSTPDITPADGNKADTSSAEKQKYE